MEHLKGIVVKFLIIMVALEIVLNLLTRLTFGEILVVSVALTVLAYILGDLLILPASNNTMATLADFVLSWAIIYAFNYVYRGASISVVDAFIAAVVIAGGEWIFHKYMSSSVIQQR